MILDNEFTGDMRVENEVISLTEAGFQVFVLCFNYGKKESYETFHGAHIIRIKINPFIKNKMKGLANTTFKFYRQYWSKKIIQFVEQNNIDVLHVHDLYLLGGAFKATKKIKNNIPIVSDLHENYPEALKYYKFSNTFPGNLLISIPKWERTEIEWVNQADYVITVIEEAVERYEQLGVDTSKISVVANYVNRVEFSNDVIDKEIEKKYNGNFTMLYVGGFDTHRGLESVLKSLPLLKYEIPNVKLILVGKGRNEDDLRQLAIELGVVENVDFEGWQLPEKLPSYIRSSNVCLIPHLKTGHTDNTIPHKLFQYMFLQKPVISTDCKPLKRIINSSKAGIIYSSDNEIELASAVKFLYDNPEDAAIMGRNGLKAVNETYNWKHTAKNLIKLYKQIEESFDFQNNKKFDKP